MEKHIVWHEKLVQRHDRHRLNKHGSCLLWFTGLSAAGKSTIAHHLEKELFDRGVRSYVLDGDNVRHGLNANLGFTREDRRENLRRIAELSKIFVDAGHVVLAAFISPYREDRDMVRRIVGPDFFEVFVKCPVDICEQRDPKGHYRKAKQGVIKNFTGVSAPYEEPENPDLVLDTVESDVEDCVARVLRMLEEKRFLLLF
ncbi:MAG: adenylyl-sulfate kinase [Thermodesulfovibrionales bacterium]